MTTTDSKPPETVAMKNCPWCGEKPVVWRPIEGIRDDFYIECFSSCVVRPTTLLCATEAEAIAAWNTRVEDPALTAALAQRDEWRATAARADEAMARLMKPVADLERQLALSPVVDTEWKELHRLLKDTPGDTLPQKVERLLEGKVVPAWKKGIPPVTGYYWINNRKSHRVCVHDDDDPKKCILADEEYQRDGASAPASIARIYIAPGDKVVGWVWRGGNISQAEIEQAEWFGPLPTLSPEPWMNLPTDPAKRAAIVATLPKEVRG